MEGRGTATHVEDIGKINVEMSFKEGKSPYFLGV